MTVTLSSRLEIQELDSRRKTKLWLTVRNCQLTQSILMIKTMFRNKVKTLRLVNEVIKLKVFNDLLKLDRFDQIVYLRDDMVRNRLCKCKVKAASKRILCQKSILYTLMKPGSVHG